MDRRSPAVRLALIVASISVLVPAAQSNAELIFGVTNTQTLVSWDSASPGTLASGIALNGLQTNETIRGIDFRPATGQLYALGSMNRLYTINISTGAATQVGAAFPTPLNGGSFGFDFNPTIDRIRVVSNQNQNLVLNPNDGTQTVATPLFFGPADPNFGVDPNVVHSAYTNNFFGATSTQLYGIDTGLNILVTQANSAGTLGTVGPTGVDIDVVGGFDISGTSGMAYAAAQSASSSQSNFYSVNLLSGAFTDLGAIGGGETIIAMSVFAVPSPSVLAGLIVGLIAMPRRRRTA